jgi:hypothetical protein
VNENAVIVTNVLIIVLICLFAYHRFRIKRSESQIEEMRGVILELVRQSCILMCICARHDYVAGHLPREAMINIVLTQPLPPELKLQHLKLIDITSEEVKGEEHEVIRSYLQQMGQKEK